MKGLEETVREERRKRGGEGKRVREKKRDVKRGNI